jgi:uncharacterized protein YjgD (DUF1641 family)
MKGFVITLILFIILSVVIIFNYVYVNNVHDNMHEMLNELTDEPSEQNRVIIQKLTEYWENKSTLLSISVSYREINNLTNAIDALSSANESKDASQLLLYKVLTRNEINAIMRLEKISIKNIL